MLKKILAITALLAFSTQSQAGVMGYSQLSITNLRLIVNDGSGDRTAIGSFANPTAAGVDISLSSAITVATNRSDLTGFLDGAGFGGLSIQRNFLAGPPNVNGPVNAPDAVSGALAGDFTRAQSSFSGSFADLQGELGIPTGANSLTRADFNVDTFGLEGGAVSNVTTTSSFEFIPTQNFTARLEFDGIADMKLEDNELPPGFATFARTSFSATLSESGASAPGFFLGDAEDSLNEFISLPPGTSPRVYLVNSLFQSSTFDLIAGSFYTLTINQTNSIGVGAVPEPTSMAVFAALGISGLVAKRRKRARASRGENPQCV